MTDNAQSVRVLQECVLVNKLLESRALKLANLQILAEWEDTSGIIMAVLGMTFHPMSVLGT